MAESAELERVAISFPLSLFLFSVSVGGEKIFQRETVNPRLRTAACLQIQMDLRRGSSTACVVREDGN